MDDRTLLELAAKAAGVDYDKTDSCHVGLWYVSAGGWWNPLTDDGDALRLAVNLGIDVMVGDGTKFVTTRSQITYSINEYTYMQDKYVATRRAIVRAAAEIGKEST